MSQSFWGRQQCPEGPFSGGKTRRGLHQHPQGIKLRTILAFKTLTLTHQCHKTPFSNQSSPAGAHSHNKNGHPAPFIITLGGAPAELSGTLGRLTHIRPTIKLKKTPASTSTLWRICSVLWRREDWQNDRRAFPSSVPPVLPALLADARGIVAPAKKNL